MVPRTKNKAFLSVYWKGHKACMDGMNADPPYADWRTNRGSVTFARAFIKYWMRGYQDASVQKGETVITIIQKAQALIRPGCRETY